MIDPNPAWMAVCIEHPLLLAIGAVTAVCVAVRFAAVWLVPVVTRGYATFVPVRYAQGLFSDDYFYYARIRRLLDRALWRTDPLIYEEADKPHVHGTYQASLLCCALPGMGSRDTIHAYMGTTALYPALQWALLAILATQCSGSMGFGIFAAAAVYFARGARNVRRAPNIMVTGVHLCLLGLLGRLYLLGEASVLAEVGLLLTVAVSPLISAANMSFTLFFMLGLMLRQPAETLAHPWFYVATLLASLPCAIPALANIRAGAMLHVFSHFPDLAEMKGPLRTTIKYYLALPLLVYGVQAASFGVQATYYGLLLGAAVGCFLVALTQPCGFFGANLTIIRGTVTLILLVTWLNAYHLAAGLLSLLPDTAWLRQAAPIGNAVIDYALALTGLALSITKCRQALAEQRPSINRKHDREFRELLDWSRTLSTRDVILTLDFDVNTSLPVYTPASFYIPQGIQSVASEDAIWHRLYEACRFEHVSFQAFLTFWARSVPHVKIDQDASLTQQGLAALDITYLKYAKNWPQGFNMPQEDIARRGIEYKRLLAQPATLSYRATVLVVSTNQLLHGTLPAKLAGFPGLKPIFANTRYAAYRLDAPTLTALETIGQGKRRERSTPPPA